MATLRKLSRCLLRVNYSSFVLRLVLYSGLLSGIIPPGVIFHGLATGQSITGDSALTVEEVVKLSHAGFSEELIVTKIKKNGKAFDLSTEELVDLKKQGISESVIRILLDPTQPYTPPPAATPGNPAQAKKYPDDPLAIRVPPDSGLYLFTGKTPSREDLRVLLGMHKGKMLKAKVATAYLAGPVSRLRAKAGKLVFYLRLPDGKEVSDLILMTLLEKDDHRELNGLPGPKGGLDADDVLQFDQLEVGPKLFRLTPPVLTVGEYMFFLVGSAEPDKGTYGKGYDFGVDAAVAEKKK